MSTSRSGFFDCPTLAVKVCGITNPDDVSSAVDAGADAIGINLFGLSKRYVELSHAIEWIEKIPVTRIAVVVNASDSLLDEVSGSGVFDAVQFHGDENPDACAKCALPWIRAVRVRSPECLDSALLYDTPWLLLDAYSEQGYGGTGSRVDWAIAKKFLTEHATRRITLAGGLNVENVGAAVAAVKPFAVDVASGVECSANPRQKDRRLMRDFIRLAKTAAAI